MEQNNSKSIVSAILQKKDKDGLKIFIQTRWKPNVSPYSGLFEIPAGVIEAYEDVYDVLKREVKEECGLDVVKIINDFKSNTEEPVVGDKAFVFKPFLCQQVLSTRNGLPWVGFVFLCEVEGEVKMQETEAKDPIWVNLVELEEMIRTKSDKIFPLQLPVLKYYLEWVKLKSE
jgi:8-oxo-dGTP pyrophosphatase MutT (NUDIX family)